MIEVKKHGMTVQVGLGTESESPEEVTRYPLYGPYKVWIRAFGVWAPTRYPECAHNLALRLKKSESVESLCGFLISVLED